MNILKLRWASLGPLAVLLVLWGIFSIISTNFFTTDNMWNISRQASALILASFAQTFAVINKGLDISIGSIVGLVSVVAAMVSIEFGVPEGIFAGCLCGAIIGATNGFFISFFKVNPIITTIGMLSLARGMAFYITDGMPVTDMPYGFDWIGSGYVGFIPVSAIIAVIALIITMFILNITVIGRNLYAVGGNEEAARLSGININFYKMLTYTISGLLAAMAAIVLSSRANSGQATLGYGLPLETIASVVIGGTILFRGEGNTARTFMGALIITTIGNGMDLSYISPYIRQIILGVIVIVAVLVSQLRSKK
jgi:ribose/xylose/arabinose/galactoside ABC-type transport system permease subunit